MRIAALLLVHHRPDLLELLLTRLSLPLWRAYVHLDRRSDAAQFDFVRTHAELVPDAVAVYWGHFSIVAATLSLMRAAIRDPANTHFYLMSGQCYPVMLDGAIERFVARAGRGDLISLVPMPHLTKPLSRLTEFHVLPQVRFGRFRRLIQSVMRLLPARDVQRLLRGIVPFAGSGWWLLSRTTVDRMLTFLDENRWFEQAFRHSQCADEMFFQTLFIHLGFTPNGQSPTAVRWSGKSEHPELIDADLFAALTREACHVMARKFSTFHPTTRLNTPDLPNCASG